MSRYITKHDIVKICISNVVCRHCGERIEQKLNKDNFNINKENDVKIVYNCSKCGNTLVYKL